MQAWVVRRETGHVVYPDGFAMAPPRAPQPRQKSLSREQETQMLQRFQKDIRYRAKRLKEDEARETQMARWVLCSASPPPPHVLPGLLSNPRLPTCLTR